MKKFFILLIILFSLQGFVFANDLIVGKSLEIYPPNNDWLVEEDYLFNFANWKITNTTDRNIYLNEVTLKLFGSGNDTDIMPMIYPDLDEDGALDPYLYGYSLVTSDDQTVTLSFDENRLIPANDHIYLMVVYSRIQDRTYNDGDTFQNYLTKLKGNFVDDGSETISTSPGNGFLSSRATAKNRPVYVIEVSSSTGKMGLSDGSDFVDGSKILSGNLVEGDFSFKVYENCNVIIDNGNDVGGTYNILNSSPIGQTFKSYLEDFNAIGINMRSTFANEEDTITVRIRKDTINGEIIKETSLDIVGKQYNSWYLFNFGENTCEASCGNQIIDAGETCDSEFLDGKICQDFEGYYGGTLSCNSCELDFSNCVDMSGDLKFYCEMMGLQNESFNCTELNQNYNTTYVTGEYDFDNSCIVDISNCKTTIDPVVNPPLPNETKVCGNGIKESGEECDINDFDNITCLDFDFEKGDLQCINCIISSDNCYNEEEIDQNIPLIDENNIDIPIIDENTPIDLNKEETDTNDFDNNLLVDVYQEPKPYFPIVESLLVLIILIIIGVGIFYYNKKLK